jgi:hypothetical protein
MNPSATEKFFSLKDRFLALLVAGCTYPMNGFGAACSRLQHIGKAPRSNFFQLVSLLLSFPCFKASTFFFKVAYSLNQRRLFCLRIKQGFLYGEDLLLELDGCVEQLCRIPQTHHGLGKIGERLNRVKALADSYQIGHGMLASGSDGAVQESGTPRQRISVRSRICRIDRVGSL